MTSTPINKNLIKTNSPINKNLITRSNYYIPYFISSAKLPFVLVFDVDGTLIDSRGYLNHSVVELLCLGIIAREHGIVSAILILTNN